jgi:hypothetical protein
MRTGSFVLTICVLLCASVPAADKPARRSPRQALQAFNDLIGKWKGTGTPEGTREQKERGLWTETMNWRWQFQGEDAWLRVSLTAGKHFAAGELRYVPEKDLFQLTMWTPAKEKRLFSGKLSGRRLVLDRRDARANQEQRLVFSFLHSNRFLYAYEVKGGGQSLFTRVYRVGATKQGVPFAAAGSAGPECVVSGGLGTIKVAYKGKTYYVCCSGCRAEFQANPEKYIKEFEQRRAKKAGRKSK